jgi:hypothetical protein
MSLKLALIFSARKIVSTIIIRFRETFLCRKANAACLPAMKIISGNDHLRHNSGAWQKEIH